MKDQEIIDHVKEYTDVIIQSGAQVNTVWQVTPLIQLGQYELEKRQTERITRLTIGVSIISMIVAAAALYIATENSRASTNWEETQIHLLEKIHADITYNNKNIKLKATNNKEQNNETKKDANK